MDEEELANRLLSCLDRKQDRLQEILRMTQEIWDSTLLFRLGGDLKSLDKLSVLKARRQGFIDEIQEIDLELAPLIERWQLGKSSLFPGIHPQVEDRQTQIDALIQEILRQDKNIREALIHAMAEVSKRLDQICQGREVLSGYRPSMYILPRFYDRRI